MNGRPTITILTGSTAAGKNTIGHLYATQHCQRGAVIDVDAVRWMLRKPHIAPWDKGGLEQHQLGVRHACWLARSFVDEGCEVVILDVLWADLASRYRQELAASTYPHQIVRLLPTWDEARRRLLARPSTISESEAWWVYERIAALQDVDCTLDNSDMTAEAVAAWLANR